MSKEVSPGTQAPEFKLTSSDGEVISLSMFRGKWVILYFYPRAMTPGCTREATRFNELINRSRKLDAVIIGVSTDSIDRLKRFEEKYGLNNIILLSDVNGEVISLYNALKKTKDCLQEGYHSL